MFLESQAEEYAHYLVDDENVYKEEYEDIISDLGKINFVLLRKERLDLDRD